MNLNVDWEKFKEFLSLKCSNKTHINNIINYSKKFGYLLNLDALNFALEFKKIVGNKKTLKRHVLEALSNLAKFLDLQYGTDFYKNFVEKRKKAGITWTQEKIPKIISESISLEKLIEITKSFEKRLKATCILHLLTGLRTSELFYLIKNFENLKKKELNKGYLIELLYLRKTKNVFFTFLHYNALNFLPYAYKSKRTYWNALKKFNLKPYDYRRAFESLYSNLRSHEIDLLQGRASNELVTHYTRDIESLANKVFEVQEKVLEKLK